MKTLQADTIRFNLQPILKEADGVTGFVLAYNNNLLNRELREYDEKRNELMNKYGEQTENGFVLKDNENFIKEISPLAEYEIEINFRKIPEEDLMNSNLKADSMAFLMNSEMVNFKEEI